MGSFLESQRIVSFSPLTFNKRLTLWSFLDNIVMSPFVWFQGDPVYFRSVGPLPSHHDNIIMMIHSKLLFPKRGTRLFIIDVYWSYTHGTWNPLKSPSKTALSMLISLQWRIEGLLMMTIDCHHWRDDYGTVTNYYNTVITMPQQDTMASHQGQTKLAKNGTSRLPHTKTLSKPGFKEPLAT